MKKVHLTDIAGRLGVSTTLVSLVLNGKGDEKGINIETQRRVVQLAEKLNYKPDFVARSLRLGSSKTIGLVVSDISNTFFSKIARSIEDEAGKHGYRVIYMSSDEDPVKEKEQINILLDRRVDGLILTTCFKTREEMVRLRNLKIPFVLVDRYIPGVKTNYVLLDNYQGSFDMTTHLLSLGYQKIALLKITPVHLTSLRQCTLGYKDALHQRGIHVNNRLIRDISFGNVKHEMNEALHQLVSEEKVQALIFVNNHLTLAGLELLNQMGLRVPQDIAVVSFDDHEFFPYIYPSITSIRHPLEEAGREAVQILLNEVMHKGGKITKKQVILPVVPEIRSSCGKYLARTTN